MKRAILPRILLLLGSTLVALVLAEVVLRVIAFNAPGWLFDEYEDPFWELTFINTHGDGEFAEGGMHVSHPTRGWKPGPNRSAVWAGQVHTTNDQGHRGGEPFVAAPRKYTVLAAGDSFTFGADTADQDTWPSVLQQRDGRLQVLNLGVAGYGLGQIAITLRESVAQYKPQLAVFAYIHDDLRRARLGFREYRKPTFVLDGNDLRLLNTPIEPFAETLAWAEGKYRLPRLVLWRLLRERIADWTHSSEQLRLLNERIVEWAMDAASESGCDFLLVHLACDRQVEDPACTDPGEQFLRYFISRHDVHYLATREKFLEQGTHWEGGHYQRAEAELVAEAVYQKILTLPSWRRFLEVKADAAEKAPAVDPHRQAFELVPPSGRQGDGA